MLVIEISKKKPKPATTYTSAHKTPGQVLIDTFKERDNIIRSLVGKIKYKPGDKAKPPATYRDKYGEEVTVSRIVTSYAQMGGAEEWPKNNNPLIVEAYDKDGVLFWCTTNFLEPITVSKE
jgi:hypothetical protein